MKETYFRPPTASQWGKIILGKSYLINLYAPLFSQNIFQTFILSYRENIKKIEVLFCDFIMAHTKPKTNVRYSKDGFNS